MALFKLPRFAGKDVVSQSANARRAQARRRKQAARFLMERLEERALLATVAITPATLSNLEGNGNTLNPAGFVYTVTRTATVAGDFTAGSVNYAVTGGAVNPADQFDFGGALPSGTLNFPAAPGAAIGSTQTMTINIPIFGDTIQEPNETFNVTLSGTGAGAITGTNPATGTIVNDDSSVSIATATPGDVSRNEGNNGVATAFNYTVTRSGSTTDPITVFYQVTGSSVFTTGAPPNQIADSPADGADFVGGSLPSGSVFFAAGQTTATITVNVNGDNVVEPTEDFTVTITAITSPSGNVAITGSPVSSQIVNDDTTSLSIAYGPGSVSKPEGNTGSSPPTQFFYVVTRTGDISGQTTVNYQVTGSSVFGDPAADANDFVFVGGGLPAGQVTFGPNSSTITITINVNGDTVLEPNEDFTVTLSNPNPSSTIISSPSISSQIVNDDALNVGIVSADADKAEGNAGTNPFTFVVTRTGDTSQPITVNYQVAGSTTPTGFAANGQDFVGSTLPSGSVAFAASQATATITINVNGDTTVEPDEGFSVTLLPVNLPGGTTITPNPAFGIIRNDDSPIVSIAPANAVQLEGNSGTTAFTFNVTRTGDTSTSSTVNYAVVGLPVVAPPTPGNPSPPGINTADFGNTTPSGSVAFGPGETSKVITIFVTGDTEVEADEPFTVALSNPNGASLGTTQANGTIINDDAGVSITFVPSSPADPNLSTPPPINGPTGPLTGNLEGNTDSNPATPFLFVLTRSGNVSGTTTVAYTVNGGIGNPPLGNPAGVGSAAASDFTGNTLPSGTVIFAPGQTTTTLTIFVNGDTTQENDEAFTVSLSNPNPNTTQLGAVASAIIYNDDEQFSLVVSGGANTVSQPEGNTGTTPFVFTINRGGNFAQDVAVITYTVTGGNATNTAPADADDFGGVFPTGQVVFGVGDTSKQVTVFVTGDNTPESNESFRVTLTNALPASQTNVSINTGTNGSNNQTILNDDTTLSIAISPFSQTSQLEGNNGVTTQYVYLVTRSIPSNGAAGGGLGAVAATYSVTPVSPGLNQFDFTGNVLPTNLPITFPATTSTNTQTQTITVSVNGDNVLEADEAFLVTLNTPPGGGVAFNQQSAPGTIINDDPGIGITISNPSQFEGNSGTTPFVFTVTRTGNFGQPIAVNYSVSGSGPNPADPADFGGVAFPSGQVVFGSGDATQNLTVFVTGDTTVEPDEGFTVTLGSTNPGGIQVNPTSAAATILNDDFARTVSITPQNATQNEGNSGVTPFTFLVTRSGDTTVSTTVFYQVTGITADQFDFSPATLPNGILFFNPGDTSIQIVIPVNGDTVVEPNEQFLVTLSSSNNAQVISGPATGTILNDDQFVPANLAITSSSNAIQFEGNNGVTTLFSFVVTRSGDVAGTTSVSYAVAGNASFTGTAANAQDFTGGILPSGTLSFGPNVTTQTIFVPVNGDNVAEPDEGFTVTLSNVNPNTGTISQATANGNILNDDAIAQNQPPTLQQPASGNSLASPGQTTITLVATDPNNDPLTFTATAQNQNRALQNQFNFFQENGTYYQNARGQQEKYLKSNVSLVPSQPPAPNGGFYYFILPNGNLYEFVGSYSDFSPPTANNSNLVANVGTAAYNDPTVLTNASFATLGVSVSGNQLTLNMPSGVPNGTVFVVTANVSDGNGGTDTKTFTIVASNQVVVNQPPTLQQPSDVTIAAGNTTQVFLQGSDPNGDALTYSATSSNLDRTLQNQFNFFQENGTFYQNARGQQEKYLKSNVSVVPGQPAASNGGFYYFILPSGDLYEFVGSYNNFGPPTTNNTNFVANIGAGGYNNPFALINASFNNLFLNVSGNQLSITVPGGTPSGTVFVVTANVSDGQSSASRTFRVTVQ